MPTLCTKSCQLVMAARSAELKKILELYLVPRKEFHDLLICSALWAREEGFNPSLVATGELGCS